MRTLAITLVVLAMTAPVLAADEEELGWSDSAELSFVATGGNSETTTIGFKNVLGRLWERAKLEITVGAIFAESRSGSSFGVGVLGDFIVVEPAKTTTAERIYLASRYDRKIHDRLFWFTGLDWDRDLPASIESAATVLGGVGNLWKDGEKIKFSTTYGGTFTSEKKTAVPRDEFGGYNLGYDLDYQITESTKFESELGFQGNLDESSDYRIDADNAVSVAISKRLALKAGLKVKFRNEPGFSTINVYDVNPLGGVPATLLGTASVRNDQVDTIFATSLVVNF